VKQLCRFGWSVLLLILAGSLSVSAAEMGYDSQGVGGEVFGRKTGIIHPFLSVSEVYTDNLTNSSTNEESDYITIFSPGIALAIPGTGNTDVRISSATGAPGGLSVSRQKLSTTKRFQAFLTYNPEIKRYKDNSDEDFTGQRVTGAFQYNAPGGLTVDIAEKYQHAQEMWGETGDNTAHATYDDNLTHAIVEFVFSPKFSITAGGSYHTLGYKHGISEFRDRDDSTYFGSFNYHVSPKTRLFLEYKRIDVSYEENVSKTRDSSEDFVSAGFSWDITAKSTGTCKFGYVAKDFDDSSLNDPSTWSGEIDLTHMLTNRTMIMVSAFRGYFESNLQTAEYYTTNRCDLSFSQDFTPKLGANLLVSYQNDDYQGAAIENDTYKVRPGIRFSPYRWLACQLAYCYTKRDSDLKTWEYSTNEYTLSVSASF
jgi:hypothetical protein